MKATLSELARHTADVVRPVIDGRHKVTLTSHGKAVAEIIPLPKPGNRKRAWQILKSIGPLEIAPRK